MILKLHLQPHLPMVHSILKLMRQWQVSISGIIVTSETKEILFHGDPHQRPIRARNAMEFKIMLLSILKEKEARHNWDENNLGLTKDNRWEKEPLGKQNKRWDEAITGL